MSGRHNYSHLQCNTLDALSETAGCLYLRLFDAFEAHRSRASEARAFMAACHYDESTGTALDCIMRHSPVHQIDANTMAELSAFFAERWRNNFMSKGVQS